ncbi:MAG: alpha/beta fold hydrolase [Dehalococcoidia bacterium]
MKRELVYFQSDGLKLKGQLFIPDATPCPVLCLCHGMPRSGTADPNDRGYAGLAERFAEEGFLTVIFNFRGSGESEGNFDIRGWARDLKVVLNHIYNMKEADRRKIFMMGFSAGAAVSIYVAAQDKRIASIVACACPDTSRLAKNRELAQTVIDDYRNMGVIKDVGFPPSLQEWMQGFDDIYSAKWIDKLSPRPILIIHGDQDDVVSPDSAFNLYKLAGEPKEIMIVKGAGHRLRISEVAMNHALSWLKSLGFRD